MVAQLLSVGLKLLNGVGTNRLNDVGSYVTKWRVHLRGLSIVGLIWGDFWFQFDDKPFLGLTLKPTRECARTVLKKQVAQRTAGQLMTLLFDGPFIGLVSERFL